MNTLGLRIKHLIGIFEPDMIKKAKREDVLFFFAQNKVIPTSYSKMFYF